MRLALTETELFYSIQQGDKNAFDTLFLRYYPMLCAYATQYVEMSDAEEIIQDIMVWFWESRKNIVIESSLHHYLFRAVKNKCLNHLHKARLHERIHLAIAANDHNPFEDPDFYIVEELTNKIEEALARLPETYRTAFILNRMEGKTYNEIAALLGVSPKTIDYRIQQALKKLRVELREYLPLLIFIV